MAVDSAVPPTQATIMPSFTSTPHGIFSRLPVLQGPSGSVVILFCSADEDPLGLPLAPCADFVQFEQSLHHIAQSASRLINISSLLQDHPITSQDYQSIYFANRPSIQFDSTPRAIALLNGGLSTPFRIPDWHLRALEAEQGARIVRATEVPFPWSGSPSIALVLENSALSLDYFWVIRLGRCAGPPSTWNEVEAGTKSAGPHWASIEQCSYQYNAVPEGRQRPVHTCPADHIEEWRNRRRVFRANALGFTPVVLSFTGCPMNPNGDTLIVNIDFNPPVPQVWL